MNRIFTLFLVVVICKYSNAQTDSVYLIKDESFFSGWKYEIFEPRGDKFIKEEYHFYKYHYWLVSMDTIQRSESPEGAESYMGCDPYINRIRNSSLYWKSYSEVDKEIRHKIGHDHIACRDFKNKVRLNYTQLDKLGSETCPAEFLEMMDRLKQKQLDFVDSVYAVKTARLELVQRNPGILEQSFVDEFIRTLHRNETDLTVLSIIALKKPELLLQAVEKIDFEIYSKLDVFPETVDLKAVKLSLKQTKVKSSDKRKMLRKMKYKKVWD